LALRKAKEKVNFIDKINLKTGWSSPVLLKMRLMETSNGVGLGADAGGFDDLPS